MAVIQLNPRTPGQRFMQVADFSDLDKKRSGEAAAGAADEIGWTQQPRANNDASSWGRAQAPAAAD